MNPTTARIITATPAIEAPIAAAAPFESPLCDAPADGVGEVDAVAEDVFEAADTELVAIPVGVYWK